MYWLGQRTQNIMCHVVKPIYVLRDNNVHVNSYILQMMHNCECQHECMKYLCHLYYHMTASKTSGQSNLT